MRASDADVGKAKKEKRRIVMADIIIAAHGTLAEGLKNAAGLIVGEPGNLKCMSLCEGDNIEDFIQDMKDTVQTAEHDVLILTDLLGASPYNGAAYTIRGCKDQRVVCVSGVNLSMVIEAVLKREEKAIEELAEDLAETGREGIQKLSRNMERSER